MDGRAAIGTLVVAAAAVLAAAGCRREDRDYRPTPPSTETADTLTTTFAPGLPGTAPPDSDIGERYRANAYDLSQGKMLYGWFNCRGCHFNGGGGIGPALMDDRWIYGGSIEAIVTSIRQGRPNGMPSFAGKITDHQIRQIAAYVLSMSGNVPAAAAPNRDDHMQVRPAENRLPQPPPPGEEAQSPHDATGTKAP